MCVCIYIYIYISSVQFSPTEGGPDPSPCCPPATALQDPLASRGAVSTESAVAAFLGGGQQASCRREDWAGPGRAPGDGLQAATLTAVCRPTAGRSCCWPSRPCGQGWRRPWPGALPSTWYSAGWCRCHSRTQPWEGPGSVRSAQRPPPEPDWALWSLECRWRHPQCRRAHPPRRRHSPAGPPGRASLSCPATGPCSPCWVGWAPAAHLIPRLIFQWVNSFYEVAKVLEFQL